MNVERLVAMANDIANYFAAEPDRAEAETGVAGHLKRFWDPTMQIKTAEIPLDLCCLLASLRPALPGGI